MAKTMLSVKHLRLGRVDGKLLWLQKEYTHTYACTHTRTCAVDGRYARQCCSVTDAGQGGHGGSSGGAQRTACQPHGRPETGSARRWAWPHSGPTHGERHRVLRVAHGGRGQRARVCRG
eukprot:172561-Pelagomonas_calceolata.AAC.2